MAAALTYFYRTGSILWYGDAEAHLDIARRIVDSRTPGWSQVGTTWLPLPHLLMLPLVRNDWLWMTGLAGGITSAVSMTIACTFLFAALRRISQNAFAASAGVAVFLLNPNTLYLGSIPMTEPVFFASFFALLYFTVRFGATKGWGALTGAALAALAATLTRYEAWLLVPFAGLCLMIYGRHWRAAAIFCVIAGAGPVLWLAHNRWYFGDPLYFYRGPYSALAIQGGRSYPGKGDWRVAAEYFFAAARLVAGIPALVTGAAGLLLTLGRRALWPVILLMLPSLFYIWSIHSAGTPIFVPTLWPNTWYNTRYAMALLPLVALGTAAVARLGKGVALLAVVVVAAPFLIHLSDGAITLRESDLNSRARRQWTARTAGYLRATIRPQDTFITSFGDMTGIYREAGVPLRFTLTGDNDVEWAESITRPDIFLHADWAVVQGGDIVQSVLERAWSRGPRYELQKRFMVRGAPVIEIYHRIYEDPVYETPRSEERLPADTGQ
jgi:hypothetical protein